MSEEKDLCEYFCISQGFRYRVSGFMQSILGENPNICSLDAINGLPYQSELSVNWEGDREYHFCSYCPKKEQKKPKGVEELARAG